MGDDEETHLADALRAIMDRRAMKMTELASRTGIPYRSLQNYLYKKSTMPADAYLKICEQLGITPDYPVKSRFTLPHHEMQEAVLRALGPVLDKIRLDDDMNIEVGEFGPIDQATRRRTAGTIGFLISHAYDSVRELASHRPLGDEG